MSRSYTVIIGDTLDSVARKTLGSEAFSTDIARANPGVDTNNLQVGATLVIPAIPEQLAPTPALAPSGAVEPTEVSLRIAGSLFSSWTNIGVSLELDAVSTVAFQTPFDSAVEAIRETFRPYTYPDIEVIVGQRQLLFTGTLVNPSPMTEPERRVLSVACYSLPGVLSDCTPPASAYPLQWDDATLLTIASDLCRPFGITVVFPNGPGPIFERISVEPGERVMSALSRLAQQRNLVIRSDEQGRLVFLRPAVSGDIRAVLEEGQNIVSCAASFAPQAYYSHVTGIAPTIAGLVGPQATVRNLLLPNVLRPYVYNAKDMEQADLEQAVRAKSGRMLAGSVQFQLQVATWLDSQGQLWEVGSFVRVLAPGSMVYTPYVLQIRSVQFNKDAGSESADLTLILPGTLSGEQPEVLPWEDLA